MSFRARRLARDVHAGRARWSMPASALPPGEAVPFGAFLRSLEGEAFAAPADVESTADLREAPETRATPVADVSPAHFAELEREAFTKGYAAGERAGLEAGGKRAEAMLRRVAHTLDELSSLRRTMIQQTERQLLQLALAVARRVLHREVALDTELAGALAHVALERLQTEQPATIRLHPEDYTVVMASRETQWEGTSVTVVPDPAIARGGCVVESEFGSIDAGIDAQLEEVSRAVLGPYEAAA